MIPVSAWAWGVIGFVINIGHHHRLQVGAENSAAL